MEYLKVAVADNTDVVPVLINDEVLGQTGEVLQVGEGVLTVNALLPGGIEQVVSVEDTTATNPLEVIIKCE